MTDHDRVPCSTNPALFDSTNLNDHHEAAQRCVDCWLIDTCRRDRPPFGEGTWAGVLWKDGAQVNHPETKGVGA